VVSVLVLVIKSYPILEIFLKREQRFDYQATYRGRWNTSRDEIERKFFTLQKKYFPWITTIPVEQGMTWEPTRKSLPNADLI
jgi:hypothetical protein